MSRLAAALNTATALSAAGCDAMKVMEAVPGMVEAVPGMVEAAQKVVMHHPGAVNPDMDEGVRDLRTFLRTLRTGAPAETADDGQDPRDLAEILKIAAAEDLRRQVDALTEALEALCEKFDTFNGKPFVNPPDNIWAKARAALAAAGRR